MDHPVAQVQWVTKNRGKEGGGMERERERKQNRGMENIMALYMERMKRDRSRRRSPPGFLRKE